MAMEDPSSKIPQSALPSAMSAFKRAKELRNAHPNLADDVAAMGKDVFMKSQGRRIAHELLVEDPIFTRLLKRIPGVEKLVERMNPASVKAAGEGAEVAAKVATEGGEALATVAAAEGGEAVIKAAAAGAFDLADDVLLKGGVVREAFKKGVPEGMTLAQHIDDAIKAGLDPAKIFTKNALGTKAVKDALTSASGGVVAAESAAASAAGKVATEVVEETAKKGGGLLGKLKGVFGGIKGNFVIAGLFSVVGNTMELMSGKMNLPQFLALTVLDTAAYGGIGVGATAAGAAIGTALFPGVGTVVGAVIAGGIGLAVGWGAGMVYEKVLRNPVKGMLGPTGGGQPAYDPNQPLVPPGQVQTDPYAQPQQGQVPGPQGQVPGPQGQVPGPQDQVPGPQGQQPGMPSQPGQPAASAPIYAPVTDQQAFPGTDGSFWQSAPTAPGASMSPTAAAAAPQPGAPAQGYGYDQAQADLDRMLRGGQ